MNLKVMAIKSPGDLKEERVVLKAIGDCDTGNYILIVGFLNAKGEMCSRTRPPFLFPSVKVTKGEYVRVYTKVGTYDTSPAKYDAEGGLIATLNHNLFWGIKGTLWSTEGDCALLVKVAARKHCYVTKKEPE